ncbi:MAG: hypothetical protein GQ578_02370 [Desulfuromonadaceae bacterium]|nr:hypothetical protein [Desulfuromonadaceae bacterium]
MTNQKKVDFIFSTLKRAEIYISYFSKLSKTSRTSLHAWKKGGNVSDMLRLNLAYNIAIRINVATREGRLPLSREGLKKDERLAALKRIISSA